MSTQLSSENPKQPPSVYSVMLFLSMIFLRIAVIAMIIEMRRWAPDYYRINTAKPSVMLMPADDVYYG